MTFEQTLSMGNFFKEFVAIVIWPALVLILIFRFSKEIGKFLDGISELTFKAGGVEATAKKQQIKVAAALGAAYAKSPSDDQVMKPINQISSRIVDIIQKSVTAGTVKNVGEAEVLWVDDRPENNIYERKALETLGVKFVISKSTEEALQKLRNQRFDIVISDMGRPPDAQAGYTLLKEIRNSGDETPFIIYAGSNAPHHKIEAKNRGAQGSTNDPNELFELVISSLNRRHV